MSEIKITGVVKKFGHNLVIPSLNLKIPSGKLTVIVGPSGCGKSTILRLIAGLDFPDSGSIWIGEKDVTLLEPRKRRVAMVFQNYALYPHLTVRENLAFPLRVAKRPKKEIAEKVDQVSRLLGLFDMLDRYPRTLSGGERQRTAVGRAIVRDPQLFLFDEPLSNLDFQLRNQMRSELVDLQHRLGITTIYVTHDQTEGLTMADELIVLNRGAIMQIGDPSNVYRRPANLFTAGFIGSPPMNLFPAIVKDGRLFLEDGERLISQTVIGNGRYAVGIRPEHLQISSDRNGVTMTIKYTEFHGSGRCLFGSIDDREFRLTVASSEKVRMAGTIGVVFPPEHLHFFDPQSGRRLEP